ncbi:hypothetical protein [Chelativorans xinjiangense]|uniref:hypothetical protein n=1 Tax=Chelativorans xinjiangense TaxID=2681485 RepID=UPI00135BFA03|nr:hypothetical protein [Chelativorans xinjiangense]
MKNHLALLACLALAAGCATKSTDIAANYVSATQYQNYSCAQLAEEARAVSAKAAQLSGTQDRRATNDKWIVGAGVVVFWPVLLLTKGNDHLAAELGQLKGEKEAIEAAARKKGCSIRFDRG